MKKNILNEKDIFNILTITNHPSGDYPHHCLFLGQFYFCCFPHQPPVENWRTFWWTWDSSVVGPWRDLISRVSLASAKYLIYTAPTKFVYYKPRLRNFFLPHLPFSFHLYNICICETKTWELEVQGGLVGLCPESAAEVSQH